MIFKTTVIVLVNVLGACGPLGDILKDNQMILYEKNLCL